MPAAPQTLTSDLGISVRRDPAMDYRSTKFGLNISSRFPFRAWTDKQTHETHALSHAGSYIAGVGL